MKWFISFALIICFGVNLILFYNWKNTERYYETEKRLIQNIFVHTFSNRKEINNIKVFDFEKSEWYDKDKTDSLGCYLYFSNDHCLPCIENAIKLLKKSNLLNKVVFLLGFETKKEYKVFLSNHPEIKSAQWTNKITAFRLKPVYFIQSGEYINSIFISDFQSDPDMTKCFIKKLEVLLN